MKIILSIFFVLVLSGCSIVLDIFDMLPDPVVIECETYCNAEGKCIKKCGEQEPERHEQPNKPIR